MPSEGRLSQRIRVFIVAGGTLFFLSIIVYLAFNT